MADLGWADGTDVVASPRQILRRQLDRLAERGLVCNAGTELEFIVFKTSYEDAWKQGYRDLEPANLYNIDYSLLGSARVEPLIRRIRNEMAGAEMTVENSKGECNLGQHEINFLYGPALRTADDHAIYKNGAKEIAAQEGHSITFIAKWDKEEGNSCHIHCSLGQRGAAATPSATTARCSTASSRASSPHFEELTLFFAPHVNSYKRFAEGSFAPTAVAWGVDNRTCAMRVVGHGQSLRVENRLPGADVNPYLALAAMIAAGLDGIDSRARARAAARGQRIRLRQAARAEEPLRRARPLRRLGPCARGLRPGGRRPLHQPRAGRAGRVRGGGDGLGEVPRLREALGERRRRSAPVVGITAALESASWVVWRDTEVNISQRHYSRVRGGGRRDPGAPAGRGATAPPTRRSFSTSSTRWSSRAEPTSTRRATAPSRTR